MKKQWRWCLCVLPMMILSMGLALGANWADTSAINDGEDHDFDSITLEQNLTVGGGSAVTADGDVTGNFDVNVVANASGYYPSAFELNNGADYTGTGTLTAVGGGSDIISVLFGGAPSAVIGLNANSTNAFSKLKLTNGGILGLFDDAYTSPLTLSSGQNGYVLAEGTTSFGGAVDLKEATLAIVAHDMDGANSQNVNTTFDSTLNVGGIMIASVSGQGSVSATFNGAVTSSGGITLDTWGSAPNATFKDTVDAKYLTTNENTGNITFEKTLTLDGYNLPDGDGLLGDNPPTTYALGIGGGTNTFADVTATDATNGHIVVAGGKTTFNGAVTSAARIWVGGNPSGVDATVILGNGASLSATNGGVEIANKGILQAGSGNTVTGDLNFKSGSTFAIDAANTLTVSGATDIEDGAMANVQNIDSIDAVGKTILASGSVTGSFGANGLYQVETDGNTVKIAGMNRVEDVLSSNNITTGNSASAGAMTTAVMNDASASAALRTNLNNAVQNIVTLAASNPELAKAAAAQLFGEHGLAGISASQTTAQNFSGSVGNHQVQLRDAAFASASATVSAASSSALASFASGASGFNPNRIWGGGFGAWTDQDDRNNMTGYEYKSGGFILGYDRKIGESLIVGLSGAYSTGEIENNDGYTTTDVDTFNVGLYASYNHCSGFFADVNAGFGFAWNDTETEDLLVPGGRKTGDYENTSFQLGGTVGYAFTLPQDFRFIPSVGVQYTHVSQDAWNEKVNVNQIANAFDESKQNYVSIPVQVRVNKTFNLGNGASITPEVRGAWIYEARDPQARVRMGYVGSNASTTLYGIDAGRSRGLIGAGVKAKFNNCVDAFVDYNYEFRSGYSNHNVMAGLGLSF